MRSRRKFAVLAVMVAGMLILANTARQWVGHFTPSNSDNVIFTDRYTLSGEYPDSLVVVANSVDGAGAGAVYGDAALVGREDVAFHGAAAGDLTVIGGRVALGGSVAGDTAVMGDSIVLSGNFSGAVTVIGGNLTIGVGAEFAESVIACVDHINYHEARHEQYLRPCQDKAAMLATFVPFQSMSDHFSGGLTGGGLLFSLLPSLLLTGQAALAVTIFPGHFSRMQEAVLTIPRGLAALGCMSGLLAIGIMTGIGVLLAVIPVLSILFIPLALLLVLALAVMLVVGWITLALLLGNYLVIRLSRAPSPPLVVVALGSFALFALWHILALLPFGSIIVLLLMAAQGSLGLGATLMTRMGTRSLRRQYFVQG